MLSPALAVDSYLVPPACNAVETSGVLAQALVASGPPQPQLSQQQLAALLAADGGAMSAYRVQKSRQHGRSAPFVVASEQEAAAVAAAAIVERVAVEAVAAAALLPPATAAVKTEDDGGPARA